MHKVHLHLSCQVFGRFCRKLFFSGLKCESHRFHPCSYTGTYTKKKKIKKLVLILTQECQFLCNMKGSLYLYCVNFLGFFVWKWFFTDWNVLRMFCFSIIKGLCVKLNEVSSSAQFHFEELLKFYNLLIFCYKKKKP